MESENLQEKIQQQTKETDAFLQLIELYKKHNDFIKKSLNFLDNLRQNTDNLTFTEEYNKQSKEQFIREIDRLKNAFEYNRYVSQDFKLKMAILLVELPPKQREIFFLTGIKKYSSLSEISRAKGCTRQTVDGILKQMFKYYEKGNEGKRNIAKKTIFKNLTGRYDEIAQIQSLCVNMPQNAEIIINNLFDEFIILDKNKQKKDHYIDVLFDLYNKRENKNIQPQDFDIL